MSDRRRVIIVGGGLAGLATAERLACSHPNRFDITVLEAKRNTGGRAGSFIDHDSGETVDYCQHVAMGCCTHLLGLLERCGQLADWTRYTQLTFLSPSTPPSRFMPSPWLPPPLHLLPTLSQFQFLDAESRRQIRRGLWQLMRASAQSLRGQTAGEWLAKQGQNETTVAKFWDVILVSALSESTSRVSMLATRKVLMDGFLGARGAADVLVPRRPLSELFGDQLPRYLNSLGVTIQKSATVHRIQPSGTPPIHQVETSDGKRFPADDVVLAVPWKPLSRLIRNSYLQSYFPDLGRYESIVGSPITGIHLWLDRPVMQEPHATIVGLLPQWLFRAPLASARCPGEHHYQVVISASHDIRGVHSDELTRRVMSDLSCVLSEAKSATVLRFKIVTDPNSVFSVTPEFEAIRPEPMTALPGLCLAGDWTKTGWPATMEGAVISGVQAAECILKNNLCRGGIVTQPIARGILSRLLIR